MNLIQDKNKYSEQNLIDYLEKLIPELDFIEKK